MYKILNIDGMAKRAEFKTVHGTIQTPVFMNVGTIGVIKGAVSSVDLENIGCQVELSNTYHLHIRPGDEIVKKLGGIHKFMNWKKPILTDSGGFQVFSLAKLRNISEEGVKFNSHIDGKSIFIGPEESIRIQSNLGSTIAMAFDECIPNPSERGYVINSVKRTTRWLKRCVDELKKVNMNCDVVNKDQILFGINQGGVYEDIRIEHAKIISEFDLPGYSIGGLAVGETTKEMYHILEKVVPFLPQNKPVYLMGVGTPENILEAIERGVDFFDCVLPARNGRHGQVFTDLGKINLMNEKFKLDDSPIDKNCDCEACSNYSRAYIRHLFKAKEMLALRLCVLHNLNFYNKLLRDVRKSIELNEFSKFKKQKLEDWKRN